MGHRSGKPMSTCWCGICDTINDLCSNLFGGDRDWGCTGIKGWNGGGNVACARFWVSEWPRKELTEHSEPGGDPRLRNLWMSNGWIVCDGTKKNQPKSHCEREGHYILQAQT